MDRKLNMNRETSALRRKFMAWETDGKGAPHWRVWELVNDRAAQTARDWDQSGGALSEVSVRARSLDRVDQEAIHFFMIGGR